MMIGSTDMPRGFDSEFWDAKINPTLKVPFMRPEFDRSRDSDDQDWIDHCWLTKNDTRYMTHLEFCAHLFKNATKVNFGIIDCNGNYHDVKSVDL